MSLPQVVRLLSPVDKVEEIASGAGLRVHHLLVTRYGPGRWRKLKGVARIEDNYGGIYRAELHWYEAHGIGRREMKIKKQL